MPTVRVNECDFQFELSGNGSDIVFIHGENHGMQMWEQQLPEFSRDHRCLAYNRRGHAGTGWTDYGFSLVNQTRDLEGLIAELGIQRPIIVALAFGTTIATQYALQNPGKVRGLVLAAWSEIHEAQEYLRRWATLSKRVATILENEGRDALIEALRREGGRTMYSVIPLKEGPVRESVIRMIGSHPLEEYKRGMLEFGSSVPDLVPALQKLDVPVVGVCGTEDPLPDRPELLAGMKGFHEVPRIEGAGRFVNWERPGEFNAVVRSFIGRCR